MDVEKLIEAAKICADPEGNCDECPFTEKCTCGMWPAEILAVRDHYEALLKFERSKVIAEVREWVSNQLAKPHDAETAYALDIALMDKLDSMEQVTE